MVLNSEAPPAVFKILIVDDDRSVAYALDRALSEKGHTVTFACSAEEGLKTLKDGPVDVLLLDLFMPGMDGTEMLRQVKALHPQMDVITMSGAGGLRVALGTLQLDAFDFLPKPVAMRALNEVLEKIGHKRKKRSQSQRERPLPSLFSTPTLLGQSPSIQKIATFMDKIAPSSSNVLILGETGTGKEIVAHGLHNKSPRRDGPFIAVNCSALPETLLESELFGHEKGAFTDALGLKRGLLEVSSGGTLFLDEIGDMPLSIQAKLLRVVESKRFRRLGSTVEQSVDVRLLAATHRDVETLVRLGQFREDLYYRLSVFSIKLPPLRERREDIALLANHFLQMFAGPGRGAKSLSEEALQRLMVYPWPGNVRELHNVMEHAVVLSEGESVNVPDLPSVVQGVLPSAPDTLAQVERRHAQTVLSECNGSEKEASRRLGISEKKLRSLL